MPNFNDAEITRLFVSHPGSTVEDDTPNAPTGGQFSVNIEMIAGPALQTETYTLTWGCNDITLGQPAPAVFTATAPPSGKFDQAPWTLDPSGLFWKDEEQGTVNLAVGAGKGHLYQYSATLVTGNGQVVSYAQSDPFIAL